MTWTQSLIDTQKISYGTRVDLHIRVAHLELGELFCSLSKIYLMLDVNIYIYIYIYLFILCLKS